MIELGNIYDENCSRLHALNMSLHLKTYFHKTPRFRLYSIKGPLNFFFFFFQWEVYWKYTSRRKCRLPPIPIFVNTVLWTKDCNVKTERNVLWSMEAIGHALMNNIYVVQTCYIIFAALGKCHHPDVCWNCADVFICAFLRSKQVLKVTSSESVSQVTK